jgi:HEAT repeat protein
MLRRLTQNWLLRRLGHWNYQVRAAACLHLGVVGDAESLGALVARLGDRDAEVRAAACRALGMLGKTEAIRSLLPRTTDRSTEVREAACLALGMLGDDGVALDLVRLVSSERSYTRRAAVEALGYIRYAPAVPVLLRLLERPEPLTQAAVALALSRIGDESASGGLAACTESPDRHARAAACRALAALHTIRGIDPLAHGLRDPAREVRKAAAESLRTLSAALEPRVPAMLCGTCLTRFAMRPAPGRLGAGLRMPVCRRCGKASEAIAGVPVVIAVLDSDMEADRQLAPLALHVNCLRHAELFDFDEVHVGRATEEEIERFCVRLGNDLDGQRRVRYRGMRAAVRPAAALSVRARHMLSDVFRVEEPGREAPSR